MTSFDVFYQKWSLRIATAMCEMFGISMTSAYARIEFYGMREYLELNPLRFSFLKTEQIAMLIFSYCRYQDIKE